MGKLHGTFAPDHVRKDFREAAPWYRRVADHGHVTAQCNLASLYFRGNGVAQDYSQAASWFRTAAEHGFAPAQENLAWVYYTGSGLSRDYTEAAKMGTTSGRARLPECTTRLGLTLRTGTGSAARLCQRVRLVRAGPGGRRKTSSGADARSVPGYDPQIQTAAARVSQLPAL